MIMASYELAGRVLTPAIRLWLKRRTVRGKEDPARLGERFGHASLPRPAGTLVWLHAASVGEAQSVVTLVRQLLADRHELHLLITTGTVTSAALVAQQALPRTIHQYVPVDTPGAVQRFLQHWQPNLAVWVESEFWPNLLIAAHRRGIKLLLINARLSARSFASWQRWPRTIARLLAVFDTIYAGTHDDAERLRALGASHVLEAGNLKFDAAALGIDSAALAQLQEGAVARPVWVAASTHPGEESLLWPVHQQLATQFPGLLTIIVPRHARRGDAIAAELRTAGASLAQRSKHEPIERGTAIYLADTMGELGTFYAFAPIVFLGGSLVAHGGHNPLEPARQHCGILSGSHVHNFASIMDYMQQENAIRIVENSTELAAALQDLLRSKTHVDTLANNAAAAVQKAGGAMGVILARIHSLLGELR